MRWPEIKGVRVWKSPSRSLSNLSSAIGRVFFKPRTLKNIPYIVLFAVPETFSFPEDFVVAKFEGLELCYTIKSSSSMELIAVWHDEDHFRVHGDLLLRKLNLEQPIASGLLAQVLRPPESFWAKYSWKEWLIGAAALLGAVSALHVHFADLFDPPEVKVAFTDTAPLDVPANTHFSAQISVLNEDAYASTKITNLEAWTICSTEQTAISPNVTDPPEIAPTQSVTVRLDGESPPYKGAGAPRECGLSVRTVARTGLIPRLVQAPQYFSAQKPVRVWPTRIGWSALSINQASTSRSVTRGVLSQFMLYPGASYSAGAKGYIIVTSAISEDVEISLGGEVDKVGVPIDSQVTPQQLLTRRVDFQTKPLTSFRLYPVSVGLRSRISLPVDRWRDLIAHSEVFVE